jgi:ribosome-associated protein
MIRVTHTISIDHDELDEQFVRASGPGGQNVNKLSSAVQLRFDVRRSPATSALGSSASPAAGSPARAC